jgi:triosephosphate isomerase
LLNHSEHRLSLEVLKLSIQRAKEVGLVVVACAQDPEEGAVIAGFGPDFVAVEPPELIGGDISVATAKPEIIQVAVDLIGRGRVLVGAGVKNSKDIEIAIMLGASGVLLASGVTKALDPEAVLRDLAKGARGADQ